MEAWLELRVSFKGSLTCLAVGSFGPRGFSFSLVGYLNVLMTWWLTFFRMNNSRPERQKSKCLVWPSHLLPCSSILLLVIQVRPIYYERGLHKSVVTGQQRWYSRSYFRGWPGQEVSSDLVYFLFSKNQYEFCTDINHLSWCFSFESPWSVLFFSISLVGKRFKLVLFCSQSNIRRTWIKFKL